VFPTPDGGHLRNGNWRLRSGWDEPWPAGAWSASPRTTCAAPSAASPAPSVPTCDGSRRPRATGPSPPPPASTRTSTRTNSTSSPPWMVYAHRKRDDAPSAQVLPWNGVCGRARGYGVRVDVPSAIARVFLSSRNALHRSEGRHLSPLSESNRRPIPYEPLHPLLSLVPQRADLRQPYERGAAAVAGRPLLGAILVPQKAPAPLLHQRGPRGGRRVDGGAREPTGVAGSRWRNHRVATRRRTALDAAAETGGGSAPGRRRTP